MIKVAWSRRTSPKAASTTDQDGFILMEFSFTTGERVAVMCRREPCSGASSWQRVLFSSPVHVTNVEVWATRTGDIFIYAEPDIAIRANLK